MKDRSTDYTDYTDFVNDGFAVRRESVKSV